MNDEQTAAEPSETAPERIRNSDRDAFRPTVTELEEHARAIVRERPVTSLLAAVGVGYVVARLLSRVLR